MYFCIDYTERQYAEFIHITIFILLGYGIHVHDEPCRSG